MEEMECHSCKWMKQIWTDTWHSGKGQTVRGITGSRAKGAIRTT